MGRAAIAPAPPPPAPALSNPVERFVQEALRNFDEKRAAFDHSVQEFLTQFDHHKSKKSAKSTSISKDSGKNAGSKGGGGGGSSTAAPANNRRWGWKATEEETVAAAPASAKWGFKRGAQKVTAADLSESDRAAIAGVGALVNPTNLASAAAVLVACYIASRALRKPPTSGGGGGDDDAKGALPAFKRPAGNLDSAYSTPSKSAMAEIKKLGAEAPPSGGLRPEGTPEPSTPPVNIMRNNFARAAAAVAPGSAPAAAASGLAGRFGSGTDAFAAVVRAKTTVSKATRRLKAAGELRIKILSSRFTDPSTAGADHGGCQLNIQCDTHSQIARGSSTLKPYDAAANVVRFHQRMSFRLPISDKEGEIRMQLCDAAGTTLCKSGLLLRAVLRAAPVTKEFPLFGADLTEVGHVSLSFEWVYESSASGASPGSLASPPSSPSLAISTAAK